MPLIGVGPQRCIPGLSLLMLWFATLPVDAQNVPPVGPSRCVTCGSGGSSSGSGLGPGGSRLTKPTPSTPASPSTPSSGGSGSSGRGGGWDSGGGSGSAPSESGTAAQATAINNEGVDLDGHGDYEAALRKYLEATALNPHDPVIQRNVRRARAKVANREGVAAYNRGDYALAVRKGEEALTLWPTPGDKSEDIIKLNLQEAREELAKQQRGASSAEEVRKGMERLNDVLRAGPPASQSSGGMDFMRDSPSPVVIGRPPTTSEPPQTRFDKGTAEGAVVDLQGAGTFTVDPRAVEGQGLQFMTGLQTRPVPTPFESAAEQRKQAAQRADEEWRRQWVLTVQREARDARARQRLQAYSQGEVEAVLRDYVQWRRRLLDAVQDNVRDQAAVERMLQALQRYEAEAVARGELPRSDGAVQQLRQDRFAEAFLRVHVYGTSGLPGEGSSPAPVLGPPGQGRQWPGPSNPEGLQLNPLWRDGGQEQLPSPAKP